MSNVFERKICIQIESASEQQEHLKNQRKTLKVLQGVATDKENLTGRPHIDKLTRLKAQTDSTLNSKPETIKRKKIETRPAETQTTPAKNEAGNRKNVQNITVEDLTNETAGPSAVYWERLADKRGTALEEALNENQRLHERIEGLETELDTSRHMLDEARNLVDILTEMLNEKEAGDAEQKSLSDTTSVTDQADDDDDEDDELNELFKEQVTSTTDDANKAE